MRTVGWMVRFALLAAPVLASAERADPQAATELQRCLAACQVDDVDCQKSAKDERGLKACKAARTRCEASCRKKKR